jgi:histone-lysine N-methyltransferase SETD1
LPTASVTPLASKGSPSASLTSAPATLDMPASAPSDRNATAMNHVSRSSATHDSSTSDAWPSIERVLARDPMPSVKGMKCTFDPILERQRNKGVSKTAKPIYKEFGLVRIITLSPLSWRSREGGASSST